MSERIERALCFCGKIQAEARGEPFWVCSDHDDDCRRAIGSPLNVWIGYRPEQVLFNSGQPKAFSRTPGVTRTFCADCGTSIGYTDAGLADELPDDWLHGASRTVFPTGPCVLEHEASVGRVS